MRYGAMNFPVLPVVEEIEKIGRLGFDYVELAMDPPMAHHSQLLPARAAIARALADHGLGLVCHLPTFISPADLTDSLRWASVDEMHRSLEAACALGAEKVVLHPCPAGGMAAFVPALAKEYAFAFFAELAAAAERVRMPVCLENMMPRNRLGVTPEDLGEIFTAFPSLRFTLDTGHAHLDDPRHLRLPGLIDRFGDRLGHLHVSDNRGSRDDHLAVGRGTVDFIDVVRRLQAIGYDDTLTLEVFEEDPRHLVESRRRLEEMFRAP